MRLRTRGAGRLLITIPDGLGERPVAEVTVGHLDDWADNGLSSYSAVATPIRDRSFLRPGTPLRSSSSRYFWTKIGLCKAQTRVCRRRLGNTITCMLRTGWSGSA